MSLKLALCLQLVAVLLAHVSLAAAGEREIRECEISATGVDERSAISDGLVQAVQQVNGLQLKAASINRQIFQDQVTELKDSFKSSTVLNDEIGTVSHGVVDGYQIISRKDNQPGIISLQMRVRVWHFPSPPHTRKVIAVLPFRSAAETFRVLGQDYPQKRLQVSLSQGVVEGLVQSRKFTILDRDFLTELLGEQKLMETLKMPPQELCRLDQLRGADLVVVGSIEDVEARQQPARLAKISVSYRVLDLVTGEAVWADTFHRTFNDNDLKSLPPERRALKLDELLVNDASAEIADQIINSVYPIRVVNVDGADVALSQGGKRVAVGDDLDVYNRGKVITDPDTGEVLERVESFACTIRVARTTSKLAYATVAPVEGAKIKVGEAVCRRHNDPLDKYLTHSGKSATAAIAVAVGSGDDLDANLAHRICDQLTGEGTTADFFTPAFVADGVLDRLMVSSARDFAAMNLSRHCTYVVLSRRTSDFSTPPRLHGMVNGGGSLDVRVLRTSDGECMETFRLSAQASEFTIPKAQARLDENLAKQFEKHGLGKWSEQAKGVGAAPAN